MTCDFIESWHLRTYTDSAVLLLSWSLCCLLCVCVDERVGSGGGLLLFFLLPEYPVRINVQN